MKDDDKPQPRPDGPLLARPEPPVVARLVIEIRSDGSRTIARGAAEDLQVGERVQIEAEGSTPLQLALSLLKAMNQVPALAKGFAKGFLGPRRKP